MFTGDDVFKQVKDLSGGEKGRLSLAKLMLSGANFLILDEPTNHLDIFGKEVLEDALADYDGTVLFVSHDRYFIERTAERIWDLYGEQIFDYPGDYRYYEEHFEERRRGISGDSVQDRNACPESGMSETADGALSWEEQKKERAAREKHQRELSKCEEEITRLEEQLDELNEMLNDPAIATDAARLGQIALEQQKASGRLEEEMERWEKLAADQE